MSNRFHKNIRMKEWDYAQSAVYMVTICVSDRSHRFGQITDMDVLRLNDAGRMIRQEVLALEVRHSQVSIDEFVVMPNHIHLILGMNLTIDSVSPLSLIDLVGEFKSRTTNSYIKGVKMGLLPAFDKKLWQEGYYETVMRDERMTEDRRQYIVNNPANWWDDPELY